MKYESIDLQNELTRIKQKKKYRILMRSTIGILLVVVASTVLIAIFVLPVLKIQGSSMNPGLNQGDIVVCSKYATLEQGDIIAFYYNNKILVKRIVAEAGDWVEITEDGMVYINEIEYKEPSINNKDNGNTNITYPYQVPDGSYFVLGDHRATSVDSRMKEIGCIHKENILGKFIIKIWNAEKS